jgi:hypothetical protein
MQCTNELPECNESTPQRESDSGTSVAGYDGARFHFAAQVRCKVLVSLLVRYYIDVVYSLFHRDLLYPRSATPGFDIHSFTYYTVNL